MKIYIASKFENRMAVRDLIKIFTAAGHTITHDWTQCSIPPRATDYIKEIIMGVIADQDIQGVVDADAVVYISYPGTRGSVGELTAGIVLNKYCFLVGKRDIDCMPEFHPNVIVCDNIQEVLVLLKKLDDLEAAQCLSK